MASAKKFKGKTYVTAVLDRSGSMQDLIEETISGFNAWLKTTQDAAAKDTFLTLHLFDDRHEVVYEQMPIRHVSPLTTDTYFTRGYTALRDAFAQEIQRIDKVLTKKDRALVLVITDGYENASKEFTQANLKAMVEEREKADNWTFQFLGADQDAITVGAGMGMHANMIRTAGTTSGRMSSFDALAHNHASYHAGGATVAATLDQCAFDQADERYKRTTVTDPSKKKA